MRQVVGRKLGRRQNNRAYSRCAVALFKCPWQEEAPTLTSVDKHRGEVTPHGPWVFPGGKAAPFTSNRIGGNYEDADIIVYSMTSGQRKRSQPCGFRGRHLPSGHIVYAHEGTMFAVAFDLKQVEAAGRTTPILEGVVKIPLNGRAQFSLSERGKLVCVTGGGCILNISISWMDREDKFTSLREIPAPLFSPHVLPRWQSFGHRNPGWQRSDICVDDWERDTLTRLTFGGEERPDYG